VEATALTTSADCASEVWVKRDDHKVVDECVVDHHGVIFRSQASVTGFDDHVPAPVEQKGHGLDHVVIGQKT
jgi:hypothetical protein